MPLGPPEDPDRFEDFEECVDALSESMPEDEAEQVCGAWETQDSSDHMTDTDDPQHRAYHQPDPDDVAVRDLEGEDGTFAVRMPIASTGEVRNEGDEPLTRDELDGMARQIEAGSVGVFLDHGSNPDIAGSRYSAIGKVGEWRDADIQTRDGAADILEADARLMDPETLPPAAGDVREALAALKSQVERDIPLASSIGWRDDEDARGGVDLMEASIVGIPADPRTTTASAATALARAALAERDAVDAEQLVEQFRAVVMGPDATRQDTPLGTLLDELVDEAAATDEFEDRDDVIGELAQEASIDESTVRNIIEGDIECPPRGRLEAFARVLDTTTEDLVAAAEQGECDYSESDENEMTDDSSESDSEQSSDTDTTRDEPPEWAGRMVDLLESIHDAVREDDMDDDDEDEDDDEQSADTDDTQDTDDGDEPTDEQSLTVDGEEVTAADIRDLREDLADAREAGAVETPDEDRDADDEPSTDTDPDSTHDTDTHWKEELLK